MQIHIIEKKKKKKKELSAISTSSETYRKKYIGAVFTIHVRQTAVLRFLTVFSVLRLPRGLISRSPRYLENLAVSFT